MNFSWGGNLCDSCLHVHFPPTAIHYSTGARDGEFIPTFHLSVKISKILRIKQCLNCTEIRQRRIHDLPGLHLLNLLRYFHRAQQGLQKEICLMEYKQQHSNLAHDGETAVLAFKTAPNERRSEIIKDR